jgi:hypothetical protein
LEIIPLARHHVPLGRLLLLLYWHTAPVQSIGERERDGRVCVCTSAHVAINSSRPGLFPVYTSVCTYVLYVHIIYQSFFHYPFISSAISLYILCVTQLLRRLDPST